LIKCVFRAGFNWALIEDKWDRFEQVFEQFDVYRWVMMSVEYRFYYYLQELLT